jgi:hypothetical protein
MTSRFVIGAVPGAAAFVAVAFFGAGAGAGSSTGAFFARDFRATGAAGASGFFFATRFGFAGSSFFPSVIPPLLLGTGPSGVARDDGPPEPP